MPSIPVSNGTLYCETLGQGPDLVLLHGMWSHHGVWSRMAPELAESFRLVLVDQMGHGKSGRIRRPYRLRDYAMDLRDLLDSLQVPKALLAGFSMGSLVAQEFASLCPDRVRGLVLIATPPPYRLRWKLGVLTVSLLESLRITTLKRQTIKALSRRYAKGTDKGLIDKSLKELAAYQDREFALILKSVWERGQEVRPERIGAPTLLLVGEKDGIRGHTESLAERIPGCRLRVVPGANHSILLDKPGAVAGEILEFLRQARLSPP